MDHLVDGIDGKLGHGVTSADELEEIDIGPRDRPRPRPTYVSAKLDHKYKQELIDLLKEFKDCCSRTDQFIRAQVQWQPTSGRTVILEPI